MDMLTLSSRYFKKRRKIVNREYLNARLSWNAMDARIRCVIVIVIVIIATIIASITCIILLFRPMVFQFGYNYIDTTTDNCLEFVSLFGDHGVCTDNTDTNAPRRMFSSFPYIGEEELLRIRLNVDSPNIDYFIIHEATYTYSGKNNSVKLNITAFPEFADRILHVVVTDKPENMDSGELDENDIRMYLYKQRVAQIKAIDDSNPMKPRPDDLIFVSDLDEIGHPHKLKLFCECGDMLHDDVYPVLFHVGDFIYDFGCQRSENSLLDLPWIRPAILPFKLLSDQCSDESQSGVCLDDLRDWKTLHYFKLRPYVLQNGGWHLSYFLSRSDIKSKLKSASEEYKHTEEMQNDQRLDCLIKSCIHVNEKEKGNRISARQSLAKYCQSREEENYYPQWMMNHACDVDDSPYRRFFTDTQDFEHVECN